MIVYGLFGKKKEKDSNQKQIPRQINKERRKTVVSPKENKQNEKPKKRRNGVIQVATKDSHFLKSVQKKVIHIENEQLIESAKNVTIIYNKNTESQLNILGELILTSYRLYFIPDDESIYNNQLSEELPDILMELLKELKNRRTKSRKEYSYGIKVVCKDFRTYRFIFFKKIIVEEKFLLKFFQRAFISDVRKTFSFFHKNSEIKDLGWSIYDPVKEYQRQGLIFESGDWRIYDINKDYSLCPTYPRIFGFPSKMEQKIKDCSKFRTKNRLPVLTWKSPDSEAVLCRSSQPKTGFADSRNANDEKLLKNIRKLNSKGFKLQIFDCRPKANAVTNKAKGGGFENTDFYSDCKLTFLGIDNIHVMRGSLKKLIKISQNAVLNDKKWLTKLEETNWFLHLQKIVYWSTVTAKYIEDKYSILVHCSDGWDRTAQVCSLAELILDPYYRTFNGFIVLIEKDWLSFGHKFSQRHGHADKKSKDKQRSPVFLQWMDCVYQFWRQYPNAFEFNEDFLLGVIEHVYSLRFGTFLGNCDKERNDFELSKYTYSLWTYMNQRKDIYLNQVYSPISGSLYPSSFLRHFSYWERLYMKGMTEAGLHSSDEKILNINQTWQYLMENTQKLKSENDKIHKNY
ncbi:myotubularin-related [Anaeramoeba ignava]|uniref:Myotubularin-related n=1 Tax=Anaeramoeba ignava TaxID=1746090 RepID=A0A9Q0LDC5_ANAIG|nr:myotubularin-related [Anaeramoeba ignava]